MIMKITFYALLFCLLIFQSCKQDEVLVEDNEVHFLVGQWNVLGTSGGFTGNGYVPNFDQLNIDKQAKFELLNWGNSVMIGRIEFVENMEENPIIRFIPDKSNMERILLIPLIEDDKTAILRGDQLFLQSPCCDRFDIMLQRL